MTEGIIILVLFVLGIWVFGKFLSFISEDMGGKHYCILDKNGNPKRDENGNVILVSRKDCPDLEVKPGTYIEDNGDDYYEPTIVGGVTNVVGTMSAETPIERKPTTVYEIQVSRGRSGCWVKHAGSFSNLRDAQIAWDRRKPSFGQGTKWRLVEKRNGHVVGTQFFMEGD